MAKGKNPKMLSERKLSSPEKQQIFDLIVFRGSSKIRKLIVCWIFGSCATPRGNLQFCVYTLQCTILLNLKYVEDRKSKIPHHIVHCAYRIVNRKFFHPGIRRGRPVILMKIRITLTDNGIFMLFLYAR